MLLIVVVVLGFGENYAAIRNSYLDYLHLFNNDAIRGKALWKQSHFMTYRRYSLLISKLFTPFVPICSQCWLYICYLGEFVKKETHRFQCFSVNDVIITRGL